MQAKKSFQSWETYCRQPEAIMRKSTKTITSIFHQSINCFDTRSKWASPICCIAISILNLKVSLAKQERDFIEVLPPSNAEDIRLNPIAVESRKGFNALIAILRILTGAKVALDFPLAVIKHEMFVHISTQRQCYQSKSLASFQHRIIVTNI